MSLILVSRHVSELRKLGVSEFTAFNLDVIQKSNVISKIGKEEFIDRLKKDSLFHNAKITTTEDGLEIMTSMTLKSMGERIIINVEAFSDAQFSYQIISKPRTKFIYVDQGKNYNNVKNLKRILER